jgi:hypothetical protein
MATPASSASSAALPPPPPPPTFTVGGVARLPTRPPALRRRWGTGIGNAARLVARPGDRTHLHPALPATVAPPRAGLPLLATAAAAAGSGGGGGGAQHTLQEWGGAARRLLDERLLGSGAILLHGLPIRYGADGGSRRACVCFSLAPAASLLAAAAPPLTLTPSSARWASR